MNYLRQFGIILILSFLGELCHYLIPLPIPASIYGLVLMLAVLQAGILNVKSVRDAAKFLIEIMPVMFIPAAVGLMDAWPVLKPVCIPFLLIMLISTIIVMACTGWSVQGILRLEEWRKKKGESSHE